MGAVQPSKISSFACDRKWERFIIGFRKQTTTLKTGAGGTTQLSYNNLVRGNGSGLCRDATMLRDTLVELIEPMRGSAGADPLALCLPTQAKASDDRLPCLENPRPGGAESSLTENVNSPFHAEPVQPLAQQSNAGQRFTFLQGGAKLPLKLNGRGQTDRC
jgi:hypothetical protein